MQLQWRKLLDGTDDVDTLKQLYVLMVEELEKLNLELNEKTRKIASMAISQLQMEAIVTTAINFKEACKQDSLDDVRLTRSALFHAVDNYKK